MIHKNYKIDVSHRLKGGPTDCRKGNITGKLCSYACPQNTVALNCIERVMSITNATLEKIAINEKAG